MTWQQSCKEGLLMVMGRSAVKILPCAMKSAGLAWR